MARFNGGWVKIYRSAILGDIGASFLRLGLFQTLLCFANIQSSTVSWKGKPRKLERGELVTSLKELAELGECHRSTILRHLEYLRIRETIIYEKSYSGLYIKINNYAKYQDVDSEGQQLARSSRAIGAQSTRNSVTHIEERKKKRKKEESHPLWVLYQQFCKEYPIKVSCTAKGFTRFLDHVSNETDYSKVLLHLTYYKKHLQKNPWKAAKQSVDTWFGTEQSGFYWLQWDSEDAGESKLKAVGGIPDVVER